MSRFREPSWLDPVLPLMALLRLGRVVGRPVDAVYRVLRMSFAPTRPPAQLRRYQPGEHDVFIAVFAKSGTNWALQISHQLAWHGRAEFDHIHDVVPWPEAPLSGVLAMDGVSPTGPSPTGRRVIKTHLTAKLVPYHPQATYITVLRDPKEVLVSAYYFVLGMFGMLDVVSFREWYELCLRERSFIELWAQHTASFWALRERPNVDVLTFGQMTRDLPGAVRRFAAAMGLSPDADVYAEVERRASFEYMRAHDTQFAPPRLPLRTTTDVPPMIRRGRSGRSGELLSRAQQAEVDRRAQAILRRLQCDLPYGELFDLAGTTGD